MKYSRTSPWDFGDPRCGVSLPENIDWTGSVGRSRDDARFAAFPHLPTVGQRIVAEAREWIGTPFKWGQSQKGQGCDCKGLVQGVFRELGLPEADTFYATFATYRPDKAVPVPLLKEGMAAVFAKVDSPEPGDVLLLKIHGRAQHLAICCGDTAIHAWAEGKERVKETRLELLLKICPLDSVWRRYADS